MKKLFIVFLLLFCFVSVALADLTQHSEAELDALLQVLDPEFDGTMDPQLVIWAGVAPSANGQSLVAAANYAAMRGLLDLEVGTDFYSVSAADTAFESATSNDFDPDRLAGDTTNDNLIDQDIIEGLSTSGSATPGLTAYDSDLLGSDKTAGNMTWNGITLTDGAEDTDWFLRIMQGGSLTQILTFDESDDQFETSKVFNSSGGFTGNLTGNVTGNASGSAASLSGSDGADSEDYTDNSIDPEHISTFYAYDNIPVAWMEDGTSAPDALDDTTRDPLAYRTFASDADEDLNFVWFVPSDLSGTTIQFRVKYLITHATGPSATEGTAWGLSGISAGDNDATNGTKGTVVVVTDDTVNAAQHDIVITGWSGNVTITNLAAGEIAECAIIRDVSDAVDDYGQVVGLIAVEIRYVKNPA